MSARRATAARSSPGGRDRSHGRLRGCASSSRARSCTAAGAYEKCGQHPWQLVLETRLANVVVCAGLPDLEHALLVVVTADGDDRELRRRCPKLSRRLDAVEHGHLDVQHDRVGLNFLRELHGLPSVACSSGYDEAVVPLEQERDGVEERLVVLGQQNPERLAQLKLLVPAAEWLNPGGHASACSRSAQSVWGSSSPALRRSSPGGTRSPSQRLRLSIKLVTPPSELALTITWVDVSTRRAVSASATSKESSPPRPG